MSKKLGNYGEQIAIDYLKQKNYQIIDHNYYIHWGEIDIIALKNNKLHFIEVKTRTSIKKGRPEEAITKSKIKKIWRVAIIFKDNSKYKNLLFQIDVISILLNKNTGAADIRHFPNVSVDMLAK
ncbi:MAG: YraN family protein [Patescibacteria group bacterium]